MPVHMRFGVGLYVHVCESAYVHVRSVFLSEYMHDGVCTFMGTRALRVLVCEFAYICMCCDVCLYACVL